MHVLGFSQGWGSDDILPSHQFALFEHHMNCGLVIQYLAYFYGY